MPQDDLGDDLLRGARAIATFTGMTERQVYREAETGRAPIFRDGGKLAAFKSSLRRHYANLEASALRNADQGRGAEGRAA